MSQILYVLAIPAALLLLAIAVMWICLPIMLAKKLDKIITELETSNKFLVDPMRSPWKVKEGILLEEKEVK